MSDEAADTAGEPEGSAHPSWCAIDHDGDDGEHRHESGGIEVPVEMLVSTPGEASVAVAGELVLIAHQGEAGSWIYAGDGVSQYLELTPESWGRVRAALDRVLAETAG